MLLLEKDLKDKLVWVVWGLGYGNFDYRIIKNRVKRYICSYFMLGMKEDDVSFKGKVICDVFWKK